MIAESCRRKRTFFSHDNDLPDIHHQPPSKMRSIAPNCTLPAEPSFVKSANVRSTLDIVSCLAVMIIATWSCLHLNVPLHARPQTTAQSIRFSLSLLRRKLRWMLVTLIAPELRIAVAAANLVVAVQNNRELARFAEEDGVPWSMAHTSLADMGGIVLRFSSGTEEDEETIGTMDAETVPLSNPDEPTASNADKPTTPDPVTAALNDWRTQHLSRRKYGVLPWRPHPPNIALIKQTFTDLAARGRDPLVDHNDDVTWSLLSMQGTTWALDSRQLTLTRQHGLLARLPTIHPDAIDDKAKADGLVKLLAVLQAVWLAVQLIMRRASNLPATQLEISAVAFAGSAVVLYATQWFRPKDVATPFYIDVPPNNSETLSLAAFEQIALSGPQATHSKRLTEIPNQSAHMPPDYDPFRRGLMTRADVLYGVFLALAGALFGSVHAAGWGMEFPTSTEQMLWRASVVVVLVAGVVEVGMLFVMDYAVLGDVYPFRQFGFGKGVAVFGCLVVMCLSGLLYTAARLFLLVESFRALYYLPPGAFAST